MSGNLVVDTITNKDVMEVIEDLIDYEEYTEAFFVCNLTDIVEKWRKWKRLMPRIDPHYAVKCNSHQSVLRTMAALDVGFDCASQQEIADILALGVSPSKIIFAQPTKIQSHLNFAAKSKVTLMTFDTDLELHKIAASAPSSKLLLRIRHDDPKASYKLGLKFGCHPERDAPRLLNLAKQLGLDMTGVCFHIGSCCKNPSAFRSAIEASSKIFVNAKKMGFEMKLLDIGGGFVEESEITIDNVAEVINKALDEFFPKNWGVEFISEPGRYFVNAAFTVATKIHSMGAKLDDGGKQRHINFGLNGNENGTNGGENGASNGISNGISNGTANCNYSGRGNETNEEELLEEIMNYYIDVGVYSGFIPVLFDEFYKEVPLKHRKEERKGIEGREKRRSIVWGPTCDCYDRVANDVMLPELEIGDWIVFREVGAYTLSISTAFNGFLAPQVHTVADENTWSLLDKKGAFKNRTNFLDKDF